MIEAVEPPSGTSAATTARSSYAAYGRFTWTRRASKHPPRRLPATDNKDGLLYKLNNVASNFRSIRVTVDPLVILATRRGHPASGEISTATRRSSAVALAPRLVRTESVSAYGSGPASSLIDASV
jgi:hypothetical protein